MKTSFNWLKDFVNISASAEEAGHRLTMAGLEIEGIEKTPDGDSLFEVNVTPNRPDCLSVLGIARELSASYGVGLGLPESEIRESAGPSGVKIEIEDRELCSRYTGRLVTGVRVAPSPVWMRERLEKSGIRPINNIVDITNYVLLEFGHPLHAFDADRLKGGLIRVARAGKGTAVRTLDAAERIMPEEALLIWDAEGPVAIAGVMGGEGSAVDDRTKNVFLESAYFKPASVRRTSKTLGLRSESSYRFERGTDIVFLEKALNRAALLTKELAGGTIHDIVDVYPVRFESPEITVSYKKINSLIGVEIPKSRVLSILSAIGISVEDKSETLIAVPPAHRRDITGYVDIVEEVARIYGYDNIPVRNPKTGLSDVAPNRKEAGINLIRDSIRRLGFNEAINYSFMNDAELDMLSIPSEDERRKSLAVLNPLRPEDGLMRTMIVPTLLRNFMHNISHGIRDIRFYEIAKTFINHGGRLPEERLRLGGIYFREAAPALWRENAPCFFIVKGALETLFEELKIADASFERSAEPFLHKGKSADIICGGKKAGFIGELSPDVVEKLDLKMVKPEIIVFELDADMLLSLAPERNAYQRLIRFPAVERDMALLIDDDTTASEAMAMIKAYSSSLIERVELFDHYKGKNIPEGKKSLAFRIIYRGADRTLTDDEVDSMHKGLVEHMAARTGAELRK